MNFLRDDKLSKCLEEQSEAPNEALLSAIRDARYSQMDVKAVKDYRQIPLNNGRMRALRKVAFRDQIARRLWLRPSLPYFGETVRASKLLIFSQWTMVPDAIAALLSYESEREMGMGAVGRDYSARHHQLLNFRKNNGRLTGLRALPLVLPSPSLAAVVDPLSLSRSAGGLADVSAMRSAAQEAVEPLARSVASKLVPPRRVGLFERLRGGLAGAAGERREEQVANWDWAVAASVDTASHLFAGWLRQGRVLSDVIRDDGQDAWTEHLAALSEVATTERLFGAPNPAELRSHPVDLALGSPATCALRALHRIAPKLALDDPALMNAAARVGIPSLQPGESSVRLAQKLGRNLSARFRPAPSG